MENEIRELPRSNLSFPHLDTFLIQNNVLSMISNEFFECMKEARVVDMASNKISSLPQSLKLLTKLRMLNLGGNHTLCEVSILGELKDLEILILRYTGIKEIPQEIGQLVNLKHFDVSDCENLSHISPGVLLNLYWLEELWIGFFSMHEGIYDSLVEVTKLSKIRHLDLLVPSFDVIPEGFSSGKLKRVKIQVECHLSSRLLMESSKNYLVLSMEYLKIPFLKWIKKFIEVQSPEIYLLETNNLHNILPTMYHEGFNKLESIRLEICPNLSSLVDTRDWDEFQTFHLSNNQLSDEGKTEEKFFMKLKHLYLSALSRFEVLWNCPDQYISLSNLVTLHILNCNKLVRVFSVSVAQGLVSLQELSIARCNVLEEVIWGGDEETDDRVGEPEIVEHSANIIVFPSLAKISLKHLNILKSFCSANSTIKYPSLEEVNIWRCTMKKWGHGIQETPKLKFVNEVPLDGPYAINDAVVKNPNKPVRY